MLTKQSGKGHKPLLIACSISFELGGGHPVVQNLSASFSSEKTGLVGPNGIGKTTFLRLLVGELEPTAGTVERTGNVAYLPQDLQLQLDQTVADVLSFNRGDQKTVGQTLKTLATFGLDEPYLNRRMKTLSGGERMKVILTSRLIGQPDFLILDEPTNNLDHDARKVVYDLAKNFGSGMLVVSHDRELLNLMARILELSVHGLQEYGGNFEFYQEQREVEDAVVQQQLGHAQKELRKAKALAQKTIERQRKRTARANKRPRNIPKITLNRWKREAQVATGKLKDVHEEKVSDAQGSLQEAQAKIRPENQILIDLSETKVPNGKLVVELKEVEFAYPQAPKKLVLEDFDLAIYGPERLSIAGPNGSGKTTLVKLTLGELEPTSGEITRGIEHSAYLDQHTAILNREKSLLENLQERQPQFSETSLRKWLGRFLFRDADVFKKAADLSGGEKMRAALAIILAGDHPPQLLVLDEPTNNLDLNSTEQIESALMNYQGALVVISHDQRFLRNIGIEREILLHGAS